jgi:N-acylneuraminate cytidylyltransferase
MTTDDNICVSTDNDEIIEVVEDYGLKVPFKRPDNIATDTSTTNDVLLHAIDFYESRKIFYDVLILLQPTSPLRNPTHIKEALKLYTNDIDMVVSVKESHASSVLCAENEDGFLELCFNKTAKRRQDMQSFYEYNGAVYIINIKRLKDKGLGGFTKKKKYIMDEFSSIDIDLPLDWIIVESILKNQDSKI